MALVHPSPNTMRALRGLRVAEEATALAGAVYRLTERFPMAERRTLGDQMRRAAVSIYANIAEGHGRESLADSRRFFDMARASLRELDAHTTFARSVGFGTPALAEQVARRTLWTARLLTALITAGSPSARQPPRTSAPRPAPSPPVPPRS